MMMTTKMKMQRRATSDGVNVLHIVHNCICASLLAVALRHVNMQASSSFGTVEPWSPRVSIL